MVLPKVEIPSRWRAGGKPPFDNFEVLLSYLATPQPFLDESENLDNQRFFLEITLQLAEELWSVQHHTMGSSAPRWLTGLLKKWNDQRAAVITLNYDTVVEAAIPEATPGGSYRNIYPFHVNFPWGTYGGSQYGPTPRTTFRLLKLHGSLNWFYGGPTAPSTTWPVDSGHIGRWVNREEIPNFSEIRRSMTGLQPLIVPPTFGKSAYFENILVRETWTEARKELLDSKRLFLLGYSAPQADVQVRTLVAETMIGKELIPVNTDSSHTFRQTLDDMFLGCRIEGAWLGKSVAEWAETHLGH